MQERQPIHNPPWPHKGQGNHTTPVSSMSSGFTTPWIWQENSAQALSDSPTPTCTQLPTGFSSRQAQDRNDVHSWKIGAPELNESDPFPTYFNFAPRHSCLCSKVTAFKEALRPSTWTSCTHLPAAVWLPCLSPSQYVPLCQILFNLWICVLSVSC